MLLYHCNIMLDLKLTKTTKYRKISLLLPATSQSGGSVESKLNSMVQHLSRDPS